MSDDRNLTIVNALIQKQYTFVYFILKSQILVKP